jgi:hypothetical protein
MSHGHPYARGVDSNDDRLDPKLTDATNAPDSSAKPTNTGMAER